MLLTLFFTPNSHCYLRRIQKWGKSWPCHNWNKWLICQILPNYPTGIWSSKSVPTFIVNFSAKDTAFKRKTKHIEADALLTWCFIQNIQAFLAEVWPSLKSALRPPPSALAESANFRPFYVKRADFSPPPPATKKRRKLVKSALVVCTLQQKKGGK